MKNIRYLQQTIRSRIEHDLVLTRIGELAYRDDNLLVRGLMYPGSSVDAVIIEGLIASPGTGMVVNLTAPAIAVQKIPDGAYSNDVKYVADANANTNFSISLDPSHVTLNRIDIIEGRVAKRSAYTDLNVSIADPVTKIISTSTRDRDYEVYLQVQKVTGTPAASPAPPSPTAATAGILLGTVDINTSPMDLSNKYLFRFAIGPDAELVEIDLRGATPSATTAAEILAKINAAGFGAVATLSGNYLQITATGTGENSVVRVKSASDPTKDAYSVITGNSEDPGYHAEFYGGNAWFKIAEIFVPASATSLTAANVRSREEKDTQWAADAGTIENGYSFDVHRKSTDMDHVDESVRVRHLHPSVLSLLGSKVTLYRGAYAPVYTNTGDATFRLGRMYLRDIDLRKADGDVQDNFTDSEQVYPVSRVDQREEDYSSGSGYSVPVTTTENVSDKCEFTPGTAVTISPNYYQVTDFAGNHNRIGVYITNGGSVTGFTHLRIILHNVGNTVEAQSDIPIADLQAVGTGWIYVDMVASLSPLSTYHYHFEMVGVGSPTPPILGNRMGTGADTLAFREMYLPGAGKYGGVNEADVVKLLDSTGARLIPIRSSGDDDILSPGDGFIGERTGTNYDVIAVDFSTLSYWQNWRYEDYIGIDLNTGRIKLPPSLRTDSLFAEFNTTIGLGELDAKSIFLHEGAQSVEERLSQLAERDNGHYIETFTLNGSTTIAAGTLDSNEVALMPATGAPEGQFDFVARSNGLHHQRPIRFRFFYAMATSDSGKVVKLDAEIIVAGVSLGTKSETFSVPSDTSRSSVLTTTMIIDAGTEFTLNDSIVIKLSRDNAVANNHSGTFKLIDITVV